MSHDISIYSIFETYVLVIGQCYFRSGGTKSNRQLKRATPSTKMSNGYIALFDS